MRYGSVCSGIECASVAFGPLDWSPAFFAEIEKFPSAVLAHHYGANLPGEALSSNGVPNLGDITQFEEWPDADIDVLIGGTPCQSYSVAGLRKGLDDPRGDLTLTYAAIARKYRPRWLVWENVFGVLSSDGGRSFASLLALLSGRRVEVPNGGWKSAGIVEGYEGAYGLSWRVLDAQYIRVDGFGRAVPQRRRRVFVVGHSGGDWRRAAAVLLERESLSGNPAPRRKAGQGTAADAQVGFGGGPQSGSLDVAACLTAKGQRVDFEVETFIASAADHAPALTSNPYGDHESREGLLVAHSLRAEGFDASGDGTGRGTPIVPVFAAAVAPTIPSRALGGGGMGTDFDCDGGLVADGARSVSIRGRDGGGTAELGDDVANALRASQGGGDKAHVLAPTIAFSCKDHGADAVNEVSPTLRAMGHVGSHANAGGQMAVAFAQNTRDEVRLFGGDGQVAGALAAQPGMKQTTYIAQGWAVRRLTPLECERLMGLPDGYTDVPYRGKPAADGPRYKALGNGFTANSARWIARRIEIVDAISAEAAS